MTSLTRVSNDISGRPTEHLPLYFLKPSFHPTQRNERNKRNVRKERNTKIDTTSIPAFLPLCRLHRMRPLHQKST